MGRYEDVMAAARKRAQEKDRQQTTAANQTGRAAAAPQEPAMSQRLQSVFETARQTAAQKDETLRTDEKARRVFDYGRMNTREVRGMLGRTYGKDYETTYRNGGADNNLTWYMERLAQAEKEEAETRARKELQEKGLDQYLREGENPQRTAGAGGGSRPTAHMKGGFNALRDTRQAEAAQPAKTYPREEAIEEIGAAQLAPWNTNRNWTPESMYQRKLEEIGEEQERILDTVQAEGRTQTAEERARLNELTEQERQYVAALQRYAQGQAAQPETRRAGGMGSAYDGSTALTDEEYAAMQGRYSTALQNAADNGDIEQARAIIERGIETAGNLQELGAAGEDQAEQERQTRVEEAYKRMLELYDQGETDSEEFQRLNAIVAGQEWTGGPLTEAGKQAEELSTFLYEQNGPALAGAKYNRYFQEQGEKYQNIRANAADFDVYADPDYGLKDGEEIWTRGPLYEAANGGIEEQRNILRGGTGSSKAEMPQEYEAAALMTDEERAMFNYLWNSPEHGEKEAKAYLEYKRREHLDKDYTENKQKAIQAVIDEGNVLQNAALHGEALIANFLGGTVGMGDTLLQNASNLFRSDEDYVPVNPYSAAHQMAIQGQHTTSEQVQALNKNLGTVNVPILGEIGWGTALNVLDSIIQSKMAAATGNAWAGAAILGASSAESALQEAYARGIRDDGQALLYALANGINETLFEEISLDKLIKMKDTMGVRNWITNILKQGFIEGSEEVNTTLANTLADQIIMRDKSGINVRIDELTEAGYTQEEAEAQAWKEWGQSLAMDFATGAVSGMGAAGTTAAMTGASRAIYNRSVNREAGEGIISQDNAQAIVDIANTLGDGSKAKKAAAKVAGQIKDGKIKAQDIGKLYREVRQELGEKSAEPIRQAIGMDVKNRLRELGVNEDTLQQLADGLVDLFAGKKLDDATGQAIAGSNEAMAVMRELMGTGREDRSAWAEDALKKNEAAMAAAQQVDELRNATRKKMSAQPESRASKAGNMDMRRAAEQTQGLGKTGTEKSRITDMETGKKRAVDIIGVKLDEDGVPTVTVRAEDGSTEDVNYRDVEYGTDAPAALVTAAAEYGKNAQKIFDAWNPASKQQMSDYIKGMQTATRMARAGVSLENIQGTVTAITAQQAAVAYQIGREMGTQALAAQEATPEQKQAQRDKAKGGNLTYTKGAREAIDMGMLNGRQQKDLKAVQALAEALRDAGVRFVVYQSREENGTYRIVDEDIAREIGQQVGEQAANGAYKDGTVYIDLNAGLSAAVKDGSMMRTVSHEVTHHIFRNGNREEVQALKDFVADRIARDGIELLGKKMSFDEYVETMQATRGLDYDAAVEEVVADASEMMLQNSTAVQELAQQNRSLFQRIRDRVTAWINAIRSAFEGVEANSREAKAMLQYADEMQQVWDTALKSALEFQEAAEEAGKDLGPAVELAQQGESEARAELPAEEAARAVETDENSMMAEAPESHKDVALSARDEYGAPMFNLRTMEEDMEFYLDDLRKMGMDTTELDELAQNLIKTMDIVRKNMDALDFDYDVAASDRPFKPVKVNADQHYKAALDFSTLCPKRVLLQAIVEQLQKELKKNVSMATQVAIRDRLKELRDNALPKIDVACALCYVEAARSGTYRWVNTFLQDRAGALKDYFAKTDRTFMSQTLTEKVNAFKNGETVTVEGVDYKTEHGAYTPNSKGKITKKSMKEENKTSGTRDVKTMEALTKAIRKTYNMSELQEKIIEDAMKISEEQFLSAGGLMQMKKEHFEVYDAFVRYLREKSRSKALETRVAYKRGDLLGTRTRSGSLIANQALIKEQNEERGFRLQSWSDFEVIHTLDYIAAIIDLAKAGSKAHAYTKVPNMVRIFGNTGIMFNLSMIPLGDTGFDENGKLAYDPREGMRENVMMELRNKFPETVGNIVIGISDEQIRALMASEDVDYIIPYHVSGASNETRHALDTGAWGDYSATQNEVVPRGKTAPRLRDWFSIEEARAFKGDGYAYMNAAAQKYLDLCAKDGITPKFPQFLTKDSNGKYTAPSGYWKLLIDRKMVNHVTGQVIEQKVVQPKFDFKMMHSIMEAWVGNKTRMQQQEAINRVLDDVKAGRIQVTAENTAEAERLLDMPIIRSIEEGAKEARKQEKAKLSAREEQQEPVEYVAGEARIDEPIEFEPGTTEEQEEISDARVMYKIREDDPPKKVGYAYKVFCVKDGKLYPPMVANKGRVDTQTGVWLDAEAAPIIGYTKQGRPIVDAGGKGTSTGRGKLAYRPGWHLGDIPHATQFARLNKETGKKELFPKNFVWALCEYAMDVDYQEEAMSYGYTKNGKFRHSFAGLPKLPTDGYYRYRTNPNPDTVPWVITGAMRVKRIMTDAETDAICRANGVEPMKRQGGPIDLEKYGLKAGDTTGEDVKYQARDNREVTDRELLADAMESIAENQAEREALEAYKSGIQNVADMEQKLQDTRIALRQAMFGKPKASQAEIERLQKQRDTLAGKIGREDERLLMIQRARPLQNILAREREQYNRQASAKVQQKVQQYREAREDTRAREVLRNEIARGVRRLDKAVRTPTDALHVPDGLKNAAAVLVGMFTQGDNKIFDREKLLEIQTAYANMAQGGMSEDSGAAGLYDEDIDGMLTQMAETLRDRTVQQLSTSELNDIRNIIDHFQFVIENADTVFMDGRRQHVSQLAENAAEQMRAKGSHVYSRLNTNALARLLGTGELTPTYFSRMIGGTMGDMFNEILRGETQFGREASKARDKVEEIQEKHNYEKWAGKKNDTLTLDTPSGKLTLTREQALGLWATRKREVTNKEQQASHLFTGGVQTEEKVKKGLLGKYTEEGGGTPLTAEEIRKIDEWLTDEQKKYADDMVGYLSREMADLGNETSMRLHGWKKFGEGYYYPYRTSADYRQTRLGDDTEASLIKAMGFTKKTTFRANTPIVISNFTDTCAGHIGKMLLYNAFAEAQDNFMRVYDYKLDKSTTTKGLVKTAWGKDATKYINRFMTDLFGGVTRDENLDMMDFLTNRFKRGAVMANMSVAIQQPTAVLRAMAMVNPKYFIGTAIHKRGSWEEAKKYAGTAVIKDMGKFDTGLGKSATEYIGNQKNYENIAKKAMNAVDTVGGYLPEQADKITWAWIWEAVKKEQAAKTGLTGETLLEAAGKRFDDVTRATQVYDSVLAKSQIMRSRDGWSRMVTSFMAEPTLSYNMLLDAVRNKHLTKGQRAASIAAVVAASIATVLAKSLVAGARKRDDDETYLESYISQVVGNLVGSKKTLHLNSELSPLTMVPVLQDILNIIDGYDVERTDMSVISDLVNAVRKLRSDSASSKQKLQTMAGAIGNLTGVPAKNIWRDADAVIGLLDQPEMRDEAILYAFREGMGYDDSKAAFAARLVEDYADGDTEGADYDLKHMQDFLKMDEKKIQTTVKTAVKEAYLGEEITWEQAEDLLVKYCGMKDKDAAYFEVEKWGYNESKNDEDPDYTKYQDLYAAIDKNESITAAQKELTDHGYDAKDVASTAKSYIGKQYKDGEYTKAQAEAKYKKYCGMDADDCYWQLRELDYAKAHKGSTDGYGKYRDYLDSVLTGGKTMQGYMNELLEHGVEAKAIASQITSEYKQQYLEYLAKGDTTSAANLQAKLLAAYELLGYDRNKKLKDIRAWEKDLDK